MTGYTPKTWVNDGAPAISAANLQIMDDGIEDAHDEIQDNVDSITLIENDIDYPSTVKQKAITDTGEDGGVEGGIRNCDFEYAPITSVPQTTSNWIDGAAGGSATDDTFRWVGADLAATRTVEFTDEVSHSGGKCIKMIQTGTAGAFGINTSTKYVATTTTPISQASLISVLPSQRYRLSGWVKQSKAVSGGEGIGVQVWEYNSINSTSYNGNSSASTIVDGDLDWTYVETVFTTNAATNAVALMTQFISTDNTSYAYVDDIKLEQIDTQTVNTQMDELASVQVEGVTTTDNVDQNQTSENGQYGVGDASSDVYRAQTFIAETEKLTTVKLKLLKVGLPTGNLDIRITETSAGDPTATIFASTSIDMSTLTTGLVEYSFDLPCILTIGTTYGIVAYSNFTPDATNYPMVAINTADGYANGNAMHSNDGTTWVDTDAGGTDLYFITHFAKHTESPIIEANGSALDLTGVELLTGAAVTVNADGSGRYIWDEQIADYGITAIHCLESTSVNKFLTSVDSSALVGGEDNTLVWKFDFGHPAQSARLITTLQEGTVRSADVYYSTDGITYTLIHTGDTASTDAAVTSDMIMNITGSSVLYIKYEMNFISANWAIFDIKIEADLDGSAELPIFAPSSEVSSETEDLVLNPIDISEDGFWQLKYDLTGWGSRTISMIADEATWEAQAVSANYIYIYDSNGTTPWAWDERNGLVPPADRTSGAVMAKFLVGDNQIRSTINNGSMKANINLSWNEESLRAAINRLTAIANLMYPIVVEVEDVPAIDLQNEPTGASAETGYTNDVTSLRQTSAATPTIAYTGLLPRENRFSEWLDITVICDDGDGVLQGKLYTADGTLIETYADLEANPVISISNPDYKYSRERLILQISASTETTSTAWSVTDIKWRYQYNG